ncbi:TPA: type I glyceraldehyde-3-phosphate dehydrogenase, partial [Candidatus Azambacteria bacterium]|nr:type I glyceraldehyde-3-phosphate dehydrogenase [Candidatus Azambacteria bacterium]
MPIKVAINGFGRIGRSFLKVALKRPEIEIVAINDLGDVDNLAYLLKYDSVYGKEGLDIKTEKSPTPGGLNFLIVNGKKIHFVQQKEPSLLPWKDLDIDVAIESTGFFESYEA